MRRRVSTKPNPEYHRQIRKEMGRIRGQFYKAGRGVMPTVLPVKRVG